MIEWFNKTLDITIAESFLITCITLFIIVIMIKFIITTLKIIKYRKCPKCGCKTKVIERYENKDNDNEVTLICTKCHWEIFIK